MKKQRNWLDFAEYASLVGLGVGSVASFVSSQVLYTSAPLSLLVLLNLANRRRLEYLTEQNTTIAVSDIDRKLSKNIELLNQQVLALPTTESMGNLKKTLLNKNREVLDELYRELGKIKQDVSERFALLDRQNLGTVRQDLAHIQDKYSQLNEAVTQLNNQLSQLSTSTRLEEVEGAIAKLKANALQLRDNLQTLTDQTRPSITSLQEQVNHLTRQFQKLPPPFDATALKQEVTELIRVVADLVPKRDWHNLQNDLKALQHQQEARTQSEESLRRKLQELNQQMQKRPEKSNLTSLQNQINHLNRQIQKLPPPFDASSLKREIAQLVKAVGELVPKRDWGALTAQIKSLQQQQEFQKQFEATLRQELQELSRQLQGLSRLSLDTQPNSQVNLAAHHSPIHTTVEAQSSRSSEGSEPQPQVEFQDRIGELLSREFQAIAQQLQELPNGSQLQAQIEATVEHELHEINQQLRSFPAGPHYELVFDFKSAQSQSRASSSRAALERALEETQERLILILPWSSHCPLDDGLVQRLEIFLQQGKRLDVGWCHQANRNEERLLSVINHRWSIYPIQKELQATLQKLLQLKRTYSQHFQFKVLGTSGNFLVSDQTFAIMGIDEVLVARRNLPDMELKLWTDDAEVIQQCIRQFDHPLPRPNDITAHWNQAITRYDLSDREGAMADFNQVLSIDPNDAIAYSYRALARYDLGDVAGAIADFNRSLDLNPHQVAAYCNRGFIRSEQGDQLGAISDFSLAIEKQPNSAIAYFYRGMADHRYNDPLAAATDFSEAIRLLPDSPMAYYYRGQAFQKLENLRGAIADFETAARLFTERGNVTNAQKALRSAAKLKRAVTQQPSTSVNLSPSDPLQPDRVVSVSASPALPTQESPATEASLLQQGYAPPLTGGQSTSNGTRHDSNGHHQSSTELRLEAETVQSLPIEPAVAAEPGITIESIFAEPALPETVPAEPTVAAEPAEPAVTIESVFVEPVFVEPVFVQPAVVTPVVISSIIGNIDDDDAPTEILNPPPTPNQVNSVLTQNPEPLAPFQPDEGHATSALQLDPEAIAAVNSDPEPMSNVEREVDFLADFADRLDPTPIEAAPLYPGVESLSNFFYDAAPAAEATGTGALSAVDVSKGDRPDDETLADFSSRF